MTPERIGGTASLASAVPKQASIDKGLDDKKQKDLDGLPIPHPDDQPLTVPPHLTDPADT